MNQEQIYDLTTEIIYNFAARNGNTDYYFSIMKSVRHILNRQGIHQNSKPMYATARLLVVLDLLRIWYP